MAESSKGPSGPTVPKISIKSGPGGSGWVDEEPSHLPGNQTRHKDLPDIHFGEVTEDGEADDDLPYVKGFNDDTDTKQEKTDQDVIDILGFDPLEFDTDNG